VLVDLRTREEVNAKGLVELPKGVTKKLVQLERTQLDKTREFKNVKGTEAGITAVQVRTAPCTPALVPINMSLIHRRFSRRWCFKPTWLVCLLTERRQAPTPTASPSTASPTMLGPCTPAPTATKEPPLHPVGLWGVGRRRCRRSRS
jgi:hypothetical protein